MRRVAGALMVGAAIALATIACGAGRPDGDRAAPPLPAAPWLAGFDGAAVAPKLDRLVASRALRCVLDVVDRHRERLDTLLEVADEAPPPLTRALALAMAARPDAREILALGAAALADRGALADARALFESPAPRHPRRGAGRDHRDRDQRRGRVAGAPVGAPRRAGQRPRLRGAAGRDGVSPGRALIVWC